MTRLVQLPELKAKYTATEAALVIDEVNDDNPFAHTLFKEAWMRSDLPLHFNRLTNIALAPQYAKATPVWNQFAKKVTLKDLTPQKYLELWPDFDEFLPDRDNSGQPRIPGKTPLIPELTEYPAVGWAEGETEFSAAKYGLRFPFSLEMVINDQLDVLKDFPATMLAYVLLLEDILQAEAFVAKDRSQGANAVIQRLRPNDRLNTVANSPLTSEALAAAVDQLEDSVVHGVRLGNVAQTRLVVPRSLARQAQQATSIATVVKREYDANDHIVKEWTEQNPAFGVPITVLDPLENVDTSANRRTTWYLVTTPQGQLGRPGVVQAELRGFTVPQTYLASSNALTAAGTPAGWQDGSFLNDDIQIKLRHFRGAAIVFAEGVLCSTGTGVA